MTSCLTGKKPVLESIEQLYRLWVKVGLLGRHAGDVQEPAILRKYIIMCKSVHSDLNSRHLAGLHKQPRERKDKRRIYGEKFTLYVFTIFKKLCTGMTEFILL